MEDGSLKLFRLPASFDPRQWPRAVANPDKNGSRAFFSTSLVTDGFLDLPLPVPLWKGPSPDTTALQAMRVGWVALDSKALRIPEDTTLLEYSAGQSRDHARDFSFCKSKNFAVVRIEDPFILKTDWNYKQLKRFLETIFPLMAACPAKIELRTRVSEEPDQKLMIQDLEKWLKPAELISYRAIAQNILAIADFPPAIGRSLPKLRPVSAQWVLKSSPQAACRNMSCRAMPNASQSDFGQAIHVRKTVACLAPAIVWLALAVKVERPFAPASPP